MLVGYGQEYSKADVRIGFGDLRFLFEVEKGLHRQGVQWLDEERGLFLWMNF